MKLSKKDEAICRAEDSVRMKDWNASYAREYPNLTDALRHELGLAPGEFPEFDHTPGPDFNPEPPRASFAM